MTNYILHLVILTGILHIRSVNPNKVILKSDRRTKLIFLTII